MKKILILTAALCLQCFFTFAQATYNTDQIAITWNLKANNYQNQKQFLAEFVIVNKGTHSFPIGESTLYFSYPRKVKEVTSKNAVFKNISGEFCSIKLSSKSQMLAPKESIKISYVASGNSIITTDAPSGLYWVFDQKKGQTYPVKDFTKNHIPVQEKAILKLSPEKVFEQNQNLSLIPAQNLQPILPSPVSYQANSGFYQLTSKSSLVFDGEFQNEAQIFNQELQQLLGTKLKEIKTGNSDVIRLKKVDGLNKEAYQIQVNGDKVVLSASYPSGMFYAIQSLKMMMPANSWAKKQTTVLIPNATIKDEPRFGYRSFMLDVARNFQTKKEILRILDLLALYKLNTLHFHLNDDEGWRLEIPSLPELTEVGAKRGHTLNDENYLHPSYGSAGNTGDFPGTGYYSKADFIEILKYAKARHIQVIPEIETPGHARAAIKSMDARYKRLMAVGKTKEARQYLLRDTLDQSVYLSVQRFNDNVMNIALPSTYAFIEKVVDDVIDMYKTAGAPLKTIHLGGDEVPKGVWQKSPAIERLMQEQKIANYDDLWYHYFAKANNILKSKGLYLSGWEEVAMRKTKLNNKPIYIANPDFANENFHAYVWNNVWGGGQEDLAYRLANAGYKVILSSATNFYFDLAYQKDADEPGLYWASFVDIDKPFYYNPLDHYTTAKEDGQGEPLDPAVFENKERLTEYGASNIVGLQSQIWSEKIQGAAQLEYMLLPKLLGFAERAWTKNPSWSKDSQTEEAQKAYQNDWNIFVNKVGQRDLTRLADYAGGFNYRIPTPGLNIKQGNIEANVQLPGLAIRYTTDGTEPTEKSKLYKSPITEKGTIKFKVFNVKGRSSRTVQIINN